MSKDTIVMQPLNQTSGDHRKGTSVPISGRHLLLLNVPLSLWFPHLSYLSAHSPKDIYPTLLHFLDSMEYSLVAPGSAASHFKESL